MLSEKQTQREKSEMKEIISGVAASMVLRGDTHLIQLIMLENSKTLGGSMWIKIVMEVLPGNVWENGGFKEGDNIV